MLLGIMLDCSLSPLLKKFAVGYDIFSKCVSVQCSKVKT
jgi:hypothetical protein